MLLKKVTGAVCVILSCIQVAEANQASLINLSKSQKPLTLVYNVAHKNGDGAVVLGGPHTIVIQKQVSISFDLQGYEFAGIVPTMINGREIPADFSQFGKAQQCSLTTNANHPDGELQFRVDETPGDGQISCSYRGGVFG